MGANLRKLFVISEHKLHPIKVIREADRDYLEASHKGQTIRIEFDKLLIATGRKPNVKDLGLENLGVELTSLGAVKVNSSMQTSISNIFACGDVAGPYQYTHMASYQAFFSSINAMLSGLWKIQANYKALFKGSSEKSRLDKYGWYNALVAVADGDLERMKQLESMQVYDVLTLLCYKIEQAEEERQKMKQNNK